MIKPCPKPAKRTCDNPDCNSKPKVKYRGYRVYNFCQSCYNDAYNAFKLLVVLTHGNWCRCPKCIYSYPLQATTIHHVAHQKHGYRWHLLEECRPWNDACHQSYHKPPAINRKSKL